MEETKDDADEFLAALKKQGSSDTLRFGQYSVKSFSFHFVFLLFFLWLTLTLLERRLSVEAGRK
jgi:hypothetical protein